MTESMDQAQSPLPSAEQPITSVDQGTLTYLRKHPRRVIAFILFVILLEVGGVALYLAHPGGARDNNFIYAFLPLLVPFAAYGYVRKRVQDEFMRQFAAANGYAFSPVGDFEGLDGALFRLGNGNRSMTDVVSGQYLDRPISLFDYRYETGGGKNRSWHAYAVFMLRFDAAMPDLLLEKKDVFSSDALLGQLPEHIKLEGDFNKYFSLSIKKGYEVEALEIFTPDIMAEMEEKCRGLSLEIVNDHLFIYENTTVSTQSDLSALYAVARYFAEKIGPVLARMQPALAAA